MAYVKQEWKDGEEGGTPITAERLNNIEEGIAEKAEQGPAGEGGTDGEQGPAGEDGFGTEEQYNDIIERLEALENGEN